ncbi:tetratricopeptide repeat protein [Calothrix sp. PCC 6303]|uniref:tetratricopeptide repeat protein n=1 Tax=Calothrix sp. PCC 6303 TaxID=1170562 RepID=UPI0002A010C5|nr:tetratricopeptide repeat protein [Calothrix sp. PCC 6303]AFZ03034.1 Tetratricopeptide TPR_1 repeat-containing protein [Calothrix sp. PCC 6303]
MRIERATLLLEQSRYEMAEKELRLALVESPSDASAHALLGLCLSYQKQYQEATQAAETAISLAPDMPFPHYILAYILCDRRQLELAEKSVMEAIRLNPYQDAYFALLARCKYNRKLWDEALLAANQGLIIDAENVECLNYRALCLSQLGRGEEALTTVEGAISISPEDATSYASSGWILLSHGKSPDKALEYFREALRLNPNLEWARQGVIEALKAQNPVYRMILRYFLWSSRLTQRNRWIFAVGLYFAIRLLLAGLNQAGFSQLVAVVAAVYLIFVILTWVADPLFTLLLRFNKFGRLALSKTEIQQSNWWAACFGVAIASLILWIYTNNTSALISAIACCLLLIPTAAMFHCEAGWTKNAMGIYTGVLVILGLITIVLSMFSKSLWLIPMVAFLVGAIASSWVATWLTGIKPKK